MRGERRKVEEEGCGGRLLLRGELMRQRRSDRGTKQNLLGYKKKNVFHFH
jgi:hypothetical protein